MHDRVRWQWILRSQCTCPLRIRSARESAMPTFLSSVRLRAPSFQECLPSFKFPAVYSRKTMCVVPSPTEEAVRSNLGLEGCSSDREEIVTPNPSRGSMDAGDPPAQWLLSPPARLALAPRIVAAAGDTRHAAQHGNRIAAFVRLHELEDPDGVEPVSRAIHAAAVTRISRSIFSRWVSRRSRAVSFRSDVLRPSYRRPPSIIPFCPPRASNST